MIGNIYFILFIYWLYIAIYARRSKIKKSDILRCLVMIKLVDLLNIEEMVYK